jgi:RNA polymerase sigma-70 factor (ECF subfamily)
MASSFGPARSRLRSAPLERQDFDAAYLDRLRNGDPETAGHFFAYFRALIQIKVRARRPRSVSAEDVLQETFLRVLRALRSPEGLRDPGSLGAFVNAICNNVVLEFCRSEGRHRGPGPERVPARELSTLTPEARLITEEGQQGVRRVIEGLPARDGALLRALFLEERGSVEVCQKMGVSRDYLRVLLHRAKKQFRQAYLQRVA